MKDKRKYIYYFIALTIILFQLVTNYNESEIKTKVSSGELTVDFIDVGQGDAILVESPEGLTMLIDAGDNSEEQRIVDYLEDKGVERLDYVIGTHPHADHIGGLDAVINQFDIGEIYMPRKSHTTKTFKDVLLAAKEKGHKIKTAKAGVVLNLGEAVHVEMVAPVSDSYSNLNDYSAVVRVAYGETSFLFTGDAEKASEDEMIGGTYPIDAGVLKLGHHGSNTSTTDEFLQAVNPEFAIVSCKKDNTYGHPNKEVMKKLKEAGIKIYSTAEDGTIIAMTDGKNIEWTTEGSSKYSK